MTSLLSVACTTVVQLVLLLLQYHPFVALCTWSVDFSICPSLLSIRRVTNLLKTDAPMIDADIISPNDCIVRSSHTSKVWHNMQVHPPMKPSRLVVTLKLDYSHKEKYNCWQMKQPMLWIWCVQVGLAVHCKFLCWIYGTRVRNFFPAWWQKCGVNLITLSSQVLTKAAGHAQV